MVPIVAELEDWLQHASKALALDEGDPRARVLQAAASRLRNVLWDAAVVVDEVTPAAAAREVDLSPDTIRLWFRQGKVRGRRRGSRILLDLNSVLEHARAL